jgi:hypothetical protein
MISAYRKWKAEYFPDADPDVCADEAFATYGDSEACRDAARSFDLWQTVLSGSWDVRFRDIEMVCLMEMSSALAFARAVEALLPVAKAVEDGFEKLGYPEFGRTLTCGMRISMAWDTNDTDIDLHVFEPSGEEAYYGHQKTQIGGLVSRDFTQGYGPEEYVLRDGMSGTYRVLAKFYASHKQDLSGATTILLTFFTDFAIPGREKRGCITLRLEDNKESIHVGDIQTVSPKWDARKRNVEAHVWAEGIFARWRREVDSVALFIQRWWRTQRVLQPFSSRRPAKFRRALVRVMATRPPLDVWQKASLIGSLLRWMNLAGDSMQLQVQS